MPRVIDTVSQGLDRVIGAWVDDGVIVDPGPSTGLPKLLEGLGDAEPRAILLTHIHLDHAGATGSLLRRFPGLPVYVHEVGAPHMVDPSRLLASAARLYGEEMERLWGEVLPVPAERVTALSGGERIDGLEVLHTPGHAAHHVCYLDPDAGTAYVGDVAGVRVPPGRRTVMPTPPPEIDVEAWLGSLEALAERGPRRLRLTHFGEAEDAPAQIDAARESLRLTSGWAAEGGREVFMRRLGALIDEAPADEAERMRSAVPPDQVWLGLERYWRKRREAG